MIVNKLYLVIGEKKYPAYTGDTTSDIVRCLIPADCEDKAKEVALKKIDKVLETTLLYEIEAGCGMNVNGENNVYRIIEGFDSEKIYLI